LHKKLPAGFPEHIFSLNKQDSLVTLFLSSLLLRIYTIIQKKRRLPPDVDGNSITLVKQYRILIEITILPVLLIKVYFHTLNNCRHISCSS
ncbi:hypothetical protein MAY67_25035, partial [Escherichia coli]